MSSKVSVSLFDDDFESCSLELNNLIGELDATTQSLRNTLQASIQNTIEFENYRKLKCYFLILGKINEWEALSDENNSITSFDLDIILKSASLDLPRTNLSTLTTNICRKIKNLKQIDELKNENVKLILSSNYLSINATGTTYTENVEKYLSSIGPVRRAEFELNTLRSRLREFIIDNEVSLLVEEGLLEHDTTWSDLLSSYELKKVPLMLNFLQEHIENTRIDQNIPVEKISASKLQKYIDCPQKYFQQYGLKQSPMIKLPSELSVLDLGQIQHKIIEKYFDNENTYKQNNHEKLVDFYLTVWLKERDVLKHVREEYFIEIFSYTQKIIQILCEMKIQLKLEHSFEYDFSIVKDQVNYNGSVDCFLSGAGGKRKILLDFKRSSSVFSSYKSILEYEQIQLWFYLERMIEKKLISLDDEIAIGYIDLSNQENSMLFTNCEDLAAELKNNFEFKKISLFENLPDQVGKYLELENEVLKMMKTDKEYIASPKDAKACMYCSIKNICIKENDGNS